MINTGQGMLLCRVVAPTCTGFGYTLHTCTSCANSYKDTETQPRGHSFATTACTRCGSAKADGEVITTEETYTYIYNGDKLSQMNVGDKSLYFAYDASGLPMSILYDTDKTDSTAGTTYYYITNIQGDVIGIADSAGTQVVSYIYDAWGNILDTDGSLEETLGTINPLRYRGYVYDQETELYYLQSRYYNPETGRFINADALASTGQGLLGNNMFAYCNNCPVNNKDTQGTAVETVLDVISLAASIAEVALNPADPWAWAGLVGDIADVCIPFVGGIGEVVDAAKMASGVIKNTDNVIDAAKSAKKIVSKSTGTYEIMYKSGKNYVGKGGFDRAIQSAQRYANPHKLNDYLGDEVVSITWMKATDDRTAFAREYLWQHRNSRTLKVDENALTYNQIWSPGRRYLGWN